MIADALCFSPTMSSQANLLAATDNSMLSLLGWIVLGVFGGLFLLVLAGLAIGVVVYFPLALNAWVSSAKIGIMRIIMMRLRQVKPEVIVRAKITAVQAGLDTDSKTGITNRRLEAHALARGDVTKVIKAIVAAHRAGIDLNFDRAAAIDLAGRDVLDAVSTSVYPKVIDCPDAQRSGKSYLSAIAKDGIELKIRARVTVRTNLDQLIGGATEETIIARVGESIISSIGSTDTHQKVLENPDVISKNVLERGLDAQTAFEIVSIDIADIDVGENIGARLQADQAEADTRVARAKAERRRAEAIASEQENKAKVAENRARLVMAEAEVPRAMADAFRDGMLYSSATANRNSEGDS